MQAPDYSSLFGSDRFADVELLLREEQEQGQDADGSAPPSEELVLRCHAVVLMGFSPYFKTKLEDWDTAPDAARRKSARRSKAQDSAAQRHRVDLPVPRGQLDVGQLLVRSMYAAVPDLSGASQRQLTQLLLLADRYEVGKVTAAVSAAIEAIPVADFAWDTLTAVYNLPPGAAELPGCRGLFAAAAAKLQHELGDLELVWADSGKQQLLLNLPFAALRQLLQDDNTRVASECTVLYSIERWCKEQQQQPPREQLRQLLGLVRMQQCGKSYVATIFLGGHVAERALTRVELGAACAVACAGISSSSSWPLQAAEWGWPAFKQFPAWTQGSRPATARAAAVEWEVSGGELRAAYDACAMGDYLHMLKSPPTVYSGVHWRLSLEFIVKPTDGTSTSTLPLDMAGALFIHAEELPESAVCHLDADVLIRRQNGAYVRHDFKGVPRRRAVKGSLFWLTAVGSYARFVSMLKQQQHLPVLEDGSIQVKVRIHNVH